MNNEAKNYSLGLLISSNHPTKQVIRFTAPLVIKTHFIMFSWQQKLIRYSQAPKRHLTLCVCTSVVLRHQKKKKKEKVYRNDDRMETGWEVGSGADRLNNLAHADG